MVRMRRVGAKGEKMHNCRHSKSAGRIWASFLTAIVSLRMLCVAEAAGFCIASELEVVASLQEAFRAVVSTGI